MTILERFVTWFDHLSHPPCTCLGCGRRGGDPALRMITGPGALGLCDRCHAEALPLVGRTGPGAAYPDNDNLTHCHFCGTAREEASGLVGWPRGAVCRNCLELCGQLFRMPESERSRPFQPGAHR